MLVEEEWRVGICIPPWNTLLLMRCSSDPAQVAALADRFWSSPTAAKDPVLDASEEDGNAAHNHNVEEGVGDVPNLNVDFEPGAEKVVETEETVILEEKEVAVHEEEASHISSDENVGVVGPKAAAATTAGEGEENEEIEKGRRSRSCSSSSKPGGRRRSCSSRDKERRRHSFSSEQEAKRSRLVWSVVTDVRAKDQLASEGLSLCSATIDGQKLVVAFGGYNGTYNNEVFVLKPKPSDSVRPRLLQSHAAAAAAASVTAAYALTTTTDNQSTELLNMNDTTPRVTTVEGPRKVVTVDTDAIQAEKKILESKLVDVRSENSRFKGNLDELNNTYTELSAELQSVQGQLEAERSRCFKLEIHISEMRQKLDSLSYVENELEALRHQKSQIETDMAVAERQGSGGVWKWVTGTT